MMTIRAIVAAFVLFAFAVPTAHAEPLPGAVSPLEAECEASYPERLADAKNGLALYRNFLAEYEKVKPVVEWFEAHCRFLNELELAARRLDDPNAYVCDPSARGKPGSLTANMILTYSVLPSETSFQTRQSDNHYCSAVDTRAGRMSLTFGELTDLEIIEILCYQDDRPSCLKARETIAKVKAKRANDNVKGSRGSEAAP